MRVLIAPGLLTFAEATGLSGRVRRITPVVGEPEAAWVGLPPTRIADGPLVVAALGAEPPERTIHFHLSVLGLDGVLVMPPLPTAEEFAVLKPLLGRLNTKRLTALAGEGLDHALVLDGWWDLGTTPAREAVGRPLRGVFPEGDFEEALRRYIDDSVNLLSELEINARRRDEGIAPLNVLWPWGQGAPRRLPNLALRRGEAMTVSGSLRMRGVARLVGYRPVLGEAEIVVSGEFEGVETEKGEWLAERLGVPDGTLVVATTEGGGLVLETGKTGSVPFRPDVAEDRSVAAVDLWEAVDAFLTSGNVPL